MGALAPYALKALIVVVAITFVGAAAARSGTRLAAILLGMPLGIAPAMILLATEQSAHFISESALYAAANVTGALAVLVGYVVAAGWLNHWFSMLTGVLLWALVATLLVCFGVSAVGALMATVLAFGATHLIVRRIRSEAPRPVSPTWLQLILRGTIAGLTLTGVVAFAATLPAGPAGLAAAAPIYMLSSMWMLGSLGGRDLVRATFVRADKSMWSYVGFCFVLYYACGPLPKFIAIAVSFGVAIGISLALGGLVKRAA
ncbi:MAG: hypothetical protein HOI95_04785 [Chromatiales bacterium]|nr:hypothetical protein [Chromatiales bacterium]